MLVINRLNYKNQLLIEKKSLSFDLIIILMR
jgi:hypothetical protein